MELKMIDEDKCSLAGRNIVEGLCLSYDVIRDLCLETMQSCPAIAGQDEEQSELPD